MSTEPTHSDPGFGVYIHWPFCRAKCPYCDFNSHVRGGIDQNRWRDALLKDLRHFQGETRDRKVTSVFFGGGTPSLMPAETAAALIEAVRTGWTCSDDLEITLEANPTSVEAETFADFARVGVNRVSIGVQSFNEAALRWLGRQHSGVEALKAVNRARQVFDRVSFDLIYGLPDQDVGAWRADLVRALDAGTRHLSLYQLTIEPGTAFHRDGVSAADPERAADLFEATQEILGGRGLPAYEISNHAGPGETCRHNLTYWRGGPYIGAGPGAHGRLAADSRTTATHQIHEPERWLERVEREGHGTAKRRPLSPEDRAMELLIFGLRLTEGIERARFQSQTGEDPLKFLDGPTVAASVEAGYLAITDERIIATAEGRLRLNALLAHLIRA